MQFYAHSGTANDTSDWEPLADHLAAVAATSEGFGAPMGIGKPCWLAGMLHDLGKFNPAFQARLSGSKTRVDHSTAGAKVVLDLATSIDDRLVVTLIAQAIAGHHAGLPERHSSDDASLDARVKAFGLDALDPAWRSAAPSEASSRLLPAFDWNTAPEGLARQLAMLGRMIFSCLVDADFKETERFYVALGERTKDRDWPTLDSRLPDAIAAFDRRIAAFGKPQTGIATLRAEILATVRERAAMPPGLFTLNVPTGGGKTLASLGFALDHARLHGHRRIITAIPFTSIIDQTATIFRDILGSDMILEHHSAIEDEEERWNKVRAGRETGEADSEHAAREKMRLAMEDWAAPVVVTTHVQLFESLFAARTSRCRKLHNIGNSVIVLDEAQVLPRHLLGPTVRAIDELARNYGCTIVLCTATQPAFDARHLKAGHPLALDLAGRELAPDPARLARALKRVDLVHGGEMTDEVLVEALGSAKQALVIINSRRHALELYRAAKTAGLGGLVHLTTRQCAAHRRRMLDDIRCRLEPESEGGGQDCRVIATSLIEAGVDVDFPRVWRAEAGLDQIMQAAGRCNREGRRPIEESVVTVFKAPSHKPPVEFEGLIKDAAMMMKKHDDLFAPEAIAEYFGETYWRLGAEGLDRKRILEDMTCTRNQGLDIGFRTIAEKYKMIETGMASVIVPYDETAREAIKQLGIKTIPSGALARRLQTYVVQTPRPAFIRLLAARAIAFAHPALREDQFAILQNKDLYTDEVGLMWDDPDYRNDEDMIV